MYLNGKQLKNLWDKVDIRDEDKCWLWLGAISSGRSGYGHINICGKFVKSHRIVWELHNGIIPKGLFVCHTCDTRRCVNPNHLFLGTQQDNMKDMINKGRDNKAKLTRKDVIMMRVLWGSGRYLAKELSNIYEISMAQVSRILNGSNWTYV